MKSWLFSSQRRFCPRMKLKFIEFLFLCFVWVCFSQSRGLPWTKICSPILHTSTLCKGQTLGHHLGIFWVRMHLGAVKVGGERKNRCRSHWEGQTDERQQQRLSTGRANGWKKLQLCAWQKAGWPLKSTQKMSLMFRAVSKLKFRLRQIFSPEYYQEGQVVMPKPLV